jgi:hypothetical protein
MDKFLCAPLSVHDTVRSTVLVLSSGELSVTFQVIVRPAGGLGSVCACCKFGISVGKSEKLFQAVRGQGRPLCHAAGEEVAFIWMSTA